MERVATLRFKKLSVTFTCIINFNLLTHKIRNHIIKNEYEEIFKNVVLYFLRSRDKMYSHLNKSSVFRQFRTEYFLEGKGFVQIIGSIERERYLIVGNGKRMDGKCAR